LPVDLAVGIYEQQFDIGDIISAGNWLFDVQASKRISIFTFYGALGYETSTLKVEYTYTDSNGNTNVNFNLKGSNNIRLTAGLTFNFGPVKLNADYNLASQSVLTLGLGVGIGDKSGDKSKKQEK
jgi:predicted porin